MGRKKKDVEAEVVEEVVDAPVEDVIDETVDETPEVIENEIDPSEEEIGQEDIGDDLADTETVDDAAEDADEPALDPVTVQYAKNVMHLSDEDIAEYKDTESLQRELMRLGRLVQRYQSPVNPQQQPPPASATGDETQTGAQQAASMFEAFKLELDPEVWGEETIGVLSNLNNHYASQFQKLEAALAERDAVLVNLHTAYQQQVAEETDRKLDGFFDSLGDDFATSFGKGSINTLSNEVQAANRKSIVQDAVRLQDLSAQSGKPVTLEDALDLAVQFRFQQPVKQQARREIQQQVQKHRQKAIARPNSKVQPKTALERAAHSASQKYREMGFDMSSEDMSLMNEI